MAHILIVDDEDRIREILNEYATFEGHTTDMAVDGMEAVAKARENKYDIIIMDAMMPRLDGFSAIKEIRKSSQVPIIMLSARGEEYDKLHGFETGADDYVVKPFSPKEVMARVTAILRRGKETTEKNKDRVASGGLEIDFAGRNVFIDGERATLTPKEYELLFFLARNNGIAFTREKLLSEVWGFDFYGDDRTVDTHIKMLRQSLGKYRDKVVTLRGLGYKIEL